VWNGSKPALLSLHDPVHRTVGTKNFAPRGPGHATYRVVKKSSWIALRVLPSSHTNPVFVVVGDKPVRASRKSAEWCLKSVDQCWSQKERAIRPSEKEEASKAYDLARRAYRKIREEAAEN